VAARHLAAELAVKLEARGLAYGYRGHPVGRDVSLVFEAGEVLCLLGPNGGGKTTLFKTLLGLIPAQGGEVLLDGRPLAALGRREVARAVAYVPQAGTGYFPFTVREIVLMGRTAHLPAFGVPGRRDRDAAEAAIARLGLAHLADAAFTRISGGERQLALIARALAQDTRLLVMDEPTASLDFGNQVKVLEQVLALARSGIGVLLSTHDPDHALLCGDRVALLHHGTLAALGAPHDVLTPEALRAAYGVEVRVEALALPGQAPRRVCVPALAGREARPARG
jgi:iron complex transport system ATP-binding protein